MAGGQLGEAIPEPLRDHSVWRLDDVHVDGFTQLPVPIRPPSHETPPHPKEPGPAGDLLCL